MNFSFPKRMTSVLVLALAVLSVFSRPVYAVRSLDPSALLLEGLLACEEAIDLSACALPADDLGVVYARLSYSHPELFHVAPRLSFTTEVAGGQRLVAFVYPTYTFMGPALTAARTLYRDTVMLLLAEMETAFDGTLPTEAERVLYLHDLLADRYAYDTRASDPNADAYRFFRDGVGICQAYALAFLALAEAAGLEADLVTSDAMDHAWNHVRVDGAWYHVDVTRDDPIPAADGSEQVNHTRLLRTDAGMDSLGYYGYTCSAKHICTDSRFEPSGEAALADLSQALALVDGAWTGTYPDGAPVAVTVGKEGITTGGRGDMDGDGSVTPADLLAVYREDYPEAWREWIRGMLVQ